MDQAHLLCLAHLHEQHMLFLVRTQPESMGSALLQSAQGRGLNSEQHWACWLSCQVGCASGSHVQQAL
jgi:hypothetical protein